MPPKRARNRAIKRPKATKTTTPRTPLSSTPGPAKITLKINTTKVSDASVSSTALTLSATPNLGVANEVEAVEPTEPSLLPIVAPPQPSSTPQFVSPLEPIIIRSPSPSQIDIWIVELEIRCYLDNERISSTIGMITNDPEVDGSTYESIKRNAEQLADRDIVERGVSTPRRDNTCWYGAYGPVGNPTEVDIGNEAEFKHVVARARNWGPKGKEKLLKLQICFGIVLFPLNMQRPPWKEPSAPKPPVIAIPKRVFQEEESHTVKKPRTATNRLLEEVEKTREAEKGTFQSILTSIQVRWACKVDSCSSSTRFCWVNDDKHYYLSAEDLRRWGHDIQEDLTVLDEPSQLHRVRLSEERRERQKPKAKTKKKQRRTYHDESSSPEPQLAAQHTKKTVFWPSNPYPAMYQSMLPPLGWSSYAPGPQIYPHFPQPNVAPPPLFNTRISVDRALITFNSTIKES
ncbi:hypothetical protein IFR05_016379 [Cadophora sp. M221]|nr:hypothetical protein IFR05_016379 [Cadophora sp. M221]